MIKKENSTFIFDCPKKINAKYFIKKVLFDIARVCYTLLLNFNRPMNVEKKRYRVSICAIFKDEANYLKEWIEYHMIVGIDHFYLYNNFSSDAYMNILEPYIKVGVVELIEWPIKQGQLKAYKDCIEKHKEETNWIGFIDIDEFVVPVTNDSIYDFLSRFENNRPCVIMYWKLFGSSGLLLRDTSKLVIEDFHRCWKKYDEVGKCFFNTAYDFLPDNKNNFIFHHFMWAGYNNIALPPVNAAGKVCLKQNDNPENKGEFPIQINHYFTKSYEEYVKKKTKGDVYFEMNPHDDEYFYHHDRLSQGSDYNIVKYLVPLKKAMGRNIECNSKS